MGLAISCVGCYVWGAATAWRWVGVCSSSYAIDAATACGQSR